MISTEGIEYTISYTVAAYSSTDAPAHRFQAITEDGQIASELYVDMNTLIIENIETAPQYRREGIATELFAAAEKRLPEVLHARPEHRTEEGNGWAEAVGGDTEDHQDEDEVEDPWN
ncbi:GNAT family N-acetyltransferase [Nocardiopsis sp. L17-MgMaSL7]|uniref:GNAT family N-acetyltransferase n=1 Tax=Nocardiopsis sp. L17-MgMaSL7 TaxID=1938893 RepID=UPI000D71AC80|nr:GNAT family N-acetyltransferase [Nocardiopsis sp. L17-MgMaSL7]PWV44577.1 acetyltransferase (GNAT) family protein [Nocardiopsis sp. L17-MgMaSL7]